MTRHGLALGSGQFPVPTDRVYGMLVTASQLALTNLMAFRQSVEYNDPRTFYELRSGTYDCEATDERDEVYAVIRLATEMDNADFEINYSKTTSEVFEQAARVLIKRDSPIKILHDASGPKLLTDLPSWVPDRSDRRLRMSSLALPKWPSLSAPKRAPPYCASGTSSPAMRFSANDKYLIIRGGFVDAVTAVATYRTFK